MNGAATNPDCHVLAYAGAQVKKGLDVAKKLGAENFGKTPLPVKNIHMFLPCLSYSVLGRERRFPLRPQHRRCRRAETHGQLLQNGRQ